MLHTINLVLQNPAVKGALAGGLAALLVDLHAWSDSSDEGYNWRKGLKRIVGGATSGAAAVLAINLGA